MLSDWLDRTVKHVEVFKDSNVNAASTVSGPTGVSQCALSVRWCCPARSVAILFAPLPSLCICHLVPGPLPLFFFAGCSFCASQQSGNLVTFLFLSVSMGCSNRTLALKKKKNHSVCKFDK